MEVRDFRLKRSSTMGKHRSRKGAEVRRGRRDSIARLRLFGTVLCPRLPRPSYHARPLPRR
jgi:hypothetical protein